MILVSKIFRYLFNKNDILFSWVRILKFKLMYPGLSIDFKSRIEKNCKITCGLGGKLTIRNSYISNGTQIVCGSNASVFISEVFIGRNCVIAGKEKIVIHSDCLIAEMVVIRDQDHSVLLTESRAKDGYSTSPIEIGSNVWLAAKSTVLKGVSIGDNSIIAASAVVNKNIPPNEVWGGIPAVCLKRLANLRL